MVSSSGDVTIDSKLQLFFCARVHAFFSLASKSMSSFIHISNSSPGLNRVISHYIWRDIVPIPLACYG